MKRLKVMGLVKDILLVAGMLAFGVLLAVLGFSGKMVLILNWYAVLVGAYMVVHYFVNMKELNNANDLIAGLMLVLAYGFVAILEFYEFTIYFLPILLSVAGGIGIGGAIQNKKEGHNDWWKKLIFGAFTLFLAVLYILAIRLEFADVVLMAGIEIILAGVCLGVERFILRPGHKKAKKDDGK